MTGSYTFFDIFTLQRMRNLLTIMTLSMTRVWKVRHIFDILKDAVSTYFAPTEHDGG
jgi:hypothetical protein